MQRSFDDLGTPLVDVTFVVVDLETTGASPATCAITEIGAVKLRGGECLGTFHTLVNPGTAIPIEIVHLTGITQAMVTPAPRIGAVLPSLLEFVRDAVVVGHNVRFDLSFLQHALAAAGYGPLRNAVVDTCSLARRLVRDEVPNLKLSTLARRFRTDTLPCHRALDDAKATAELLHHLLERAGTLGVLALDDLLVLPTTAAHPQAAKLRWVARLPRRPGVYVFRGPDGQALYVGKATDLRRRVRSYFGADDRRTIGPLLREARRLDHVICANDLEAAVVEARMIRDLQPRYNRRSRHWRRYVYVKLTTAERFPRLSVVRQARDDGAVYLGPLPSRRAARDVIDAVESALPLRRCTARPPQTARSGPCAPAQLGLSLCPCAGGVADDEYQAVARLAAEAMTERPELVLDPLTTRMDALARARRFEEAAAVRDRARAFADAVRRRWQLGALRDAGRVVVTLPDGTGAVLEHGRLVCAWEAGERPRQEPFAGTEPAPMPSPEEVDELLCVAAWLRARAGELRLEFCEGGLAWPAQALPDLDPDRRRSARQRAA